VLLLDPIWYTVGLNQLDLFKEYLGVVKKVLTELSRNVKDRLEYQGRHQVKAMFKNLLLKCDFYSSKRVLLNLTDNGLNDTDINETCSMRNVDSSVNLSLTLLD
jgi:hypothetical protein